MPRPERERELQLSLVYDRYLLIHEYRAAMHLYGDPADSENESEEAMIQAIANRKKPKMPPK
ncbi:hypothetical protein [Anatilimnocola floriformis]|uniref:hypothetical protein n=1 Tax=Anatilimnocola floriformis TaxID=2948575 RepID=UPI0020C4A07C|nr:hypothetical protein [Anatilimnocola floriformis]